VLILCYADTYTEAEFRREATRYLEIPYPSKRSLLAAHRDRSLILAAAQLASRGEGMRNRLLSDLSMESRPLPDLSADATVDSLVLFSDQAKHNAFGRVERSGLIRHRSVELCGVGALAFYLFIKWQVVGRPIPDFAPNFDDPKGGQYGLRPWLKVHLFPSSKGDDEPMSYESKPQSTILSIPSNIW
jgi:hypothetical protein